MATAVLTTRCSRGAQSPRVLDPARRQSSDKLRASAASRQPLAFSLQPRALSARAAFSLLEVLLATTVLIIIIMVISLVFRQTHNAWTSGTRRADADTVLRSIMGFVERDLTHAVDGTRFGQVPVFAADRFKCVTLDGPRRVPLLVDYTFAGGNLTRTTTELFVPLGTTNWQLAATNITQSAINGNFALSQCLFSFPPIPAGATLPVRVDVQVGLSRSNTFSIVTGRSLGPDGVLKTKDDVIAGE